MIVKMIKSLKNKTEKMKESINKGLEELKNKHTETNTVCLCLSHTETDTVTEIKNTLEGINNSILKQKNKLVSWKIKWWK